MLAVVRKHAPARPRVRRKSPADKMNAQLRAFQAWGARQARLFITAPNIELGGEDLVAVRKLGEVLQAVDGLQRALYRLKRRGWGGR
jgi:hypothetical protein